MVFSSFSSDFVSPLFPKKGDDVRLSVAFTDYPDSVLLSYYSDTGLLNNIKMNEDGDINGAFKFSATVPVSSDEFPFYYFFIFFKDGKSYYYSKEGVSRNCPSRKNRFKLIPSLEAPEWISSSTCYQIFPDRFCSGDSSVGAVDGMYEFDGGVVSVHSFDEIPESYDKARCLDFFNGDLKGIEDKIDYLKSFGIDCIYLNPINCSRTVHRFDATDFFHVDEKLGGDAALSSLIDKLHENGIRVVVDISINHTSSDSPWLKKALSDKESIYRSFYKFNENGEPECWQGVPTLVQLNYNSDVLRNRIYRDYDSALKKFLRPPFDQDGWRLDVAPELARYNDSQLCQEVWREVRKELKGEKSDCYLVGEEWDDAYDYLMGDMWDGTMNYFGSGRPIRSWLGERDRFLSSGWGHSPEKEEGWNGFEFASALREGYDSTPDQMAFFQMNLFDSHDTPRLHNNTEIYDKKLYFGGLIVLYLLPGMPNIYYGDEIALAGEMGSVEASRYPMNWNESEWDMETLNVHKTLGEMRKLQWLGYASFDVEALDEKSIVIKRFVDGDAIVGVVNKADVRRNLSISLDFLPKNSVDVLFGTNKAVIDGEKLIVSLEEKESVVLRLR